MKPNIKVQKIVMRNTFERHGKPVYFINRYIYTNLFHMALKFGIPLIVYGENVSCTYGDADDEDTYSARKQIFNGVASGISTEEIVSYGIKEEELFFFDPPSNEDLEKLDPIYLSYFVPWNSYRNYVFAKRRGFHDLTHE